MVSAKRRKIGGKIAGEAEAIRYRRNHKFIAYVHYEIFHKIPECSEKRREISKSLSLSFAPNIIGQNILSFIHSPCDCCQVFQVGQRG